MCQCKIKRILKRFCTILLMMICIFCLCGCGKQDYFLQINDDDTCNFTIKLTINRDTYNSLSSDYEVDIDQLNREKNTMTGTDMDNVDAVFQETAAIFNQYGYQITAINDTIDIGFEASKKYNTIAELNAEIAELHSINLIGVNLQVGKEQTRYQKTYRCYGELDYILDEDIDMKDDFISKMFLSQADLESLTCQFSVVMPYSTVLERTDGTASPNGYTWTSSYQGSATPIHIISSARNTSAYIVTFLIGIVVIVGLIIMISRFIRQYKSKRRYEQSKDYLSDKFDDDDDEDDDE